MKKSIIWSIAIILGIVAIQACNQSGAPKEKKSESTEETVHVDYYCPNDCEKGKIYHKPGNCPVCGSVLLKDENHEKDHHDGDYNYSHSNDSGANNDKHEHHRGDGHKH